MSTSDEQDIVAAYAGCADIYEMVSKSRPGKIHRFYVFSDLTVTCSCEGYQYRKACKHVEAYKNGEFPPGKFDATGGDDFQLSL